MRNNHKHARTELVEAIHINLHGDDVAHRARIACKQTSSLNCCRDL